MVARRTLIAAAAWSVPAVAVLTATPAFAASQGTITMAVTGATSDDRLTWSGVTLSRQIVGTIKIKLTNVGNTSAASFTAVTQFVRVASAWGLPVNDGAHSTVTAAPVVVGPNGTGEIAFTSHSGLNAGTWRITYSVTATDGTGAAVPPGPLTGTLTQYVDWLVDN
jgi:hypothetical protein